LATPQLARLLRRAAQGIKTPDAKISYDHTYSCGASRRRRSSSGSALRSSSIIVSKALASSAPTACTSTGFCERGLAAAGASAEVAAAPSRR